jgi:4'-phosphopantetheinyl transferase
MSRQNLRQAVITHLEDTRVNSDGVDIWYCEFESNRDKIREIDGFLSPDEVERGSRFRFEKDRLNFVFARGLLRLIAGQYLELAPGQIEFSYGEQGKPKIDDADFSFNLSHSKDMAVYAFSRFETVGIDIEWTGRKVETEDVARQFFSKKEFESLIELSTVEQNHAFFNIWTRKEALIKAIGEGLSFPLDQFKVSHGEEAELVETYWNPEEKNHWSMESFELREDYATSVAVRGKPHSYCVFEL